MKTDHKEFVVNNRTVKNTVFLSDCLELMSQLEDNAIDLAVVDPPYFSGPEKRGHYGNEISTTGIKSINYPKTKSWEVPSIIFFNELFRVSKHQIIFGINYFETPNLPPGRIIWDKVNGQTSFSDCEIAYCSLHDSVRIIRYMWNGCFQGKSIKEGHLQQGNKKLNEQRIHPTQKPILLYEWLFSEYAREGFKILDTHLGSQSSRIAAYNLGLDFLASEKEEIHFSNGNKRFNAHIKQTRTDIESVSPEQLSII